MVFNYFFKKTEKTIDFKAAFDPNSFMVETIFDLIDFIYENLKFKEALIAQRNRMKYYRTDVIVDLFTENKGTQNSKGLFQNASKVNYQRKSTKCSTHFLFRLIKDFHLKMKVKKNRVSGCNCEN